MNKNYNESTIKIGTFFSGIGSPEKALERLKEESIIKNYSIEFFSEINKDAIKSYCAVHDVSEKLNLGDINNIKGYDLPYCDLWVGGFPCQDISCAGKMKGFDSDSTTRSSLGWEMIRLISEITNKPKIVIFENVSSITSKKFKNTLELFKSDIESLGYSIHEKVLNSYDYGVAQARKRYFLIAILNNEISFQFPVEDNNHLVFKDILEKKVDEKYYLTSCVYETIDDNNIMLRHKKRDDIEYVVDLEKYKTGGVCGKDKHTKFAISSRLFSENGKAPTLTACNTADNAKLVIKEAK